MIKTETRQNQHEFNKQEDKEMIKLETRHIADEIFPDKGFDCKYFVNDDGRDIQCDYIKNKYGEATTENAQKFFDEQAKNNEIENEIKKEKALVKNAATEIYLKISEFVLRSLVHFTKDGTGFEVTAYLHPEGEGSDPDEHEIFVSIIDGDSKSAFYTTYVKNETISRKVIEALKSMFPCDLVEFHETYRD